MPLDPPSYCFPALSKQQASPSGEDPDMCLFPMEQQQSPTKLNFIGQEACGCGTSGIVQYK